MHLFCHSLLLNPVIFSSAKYIHRLEEVLDTIIKPGYNCYLTSDAANGYWAIPMKWGNENKTGFMTPNGQWVYLRMGQGLKGAAYTYSQFSKLVFGPLPGTSNGKIVRKPTIIGKNKDAAFSIYMGWSCCIYTGLWCNVQVSEYKIFSSSHIWPCLPGK